MEEVERGEETEDQKEKKWKKTKKMVKNQSGRRKPTMEEQLIKKENDKYLIRNCRFNLMGVHENMKKDQVYQQEHQKVLQMVENLKEQLAKLSKEDSRMSNEIIFQTNKALSSHQLSQNFQ